MFIYAFLSEGVGQFSFQATPPVLRPGGRVNVIPTPQPLLVIPGVPIPEIRTQYMVQVFYDRYAGRQSQPYWIENKKHLRGFSSAGEASSYFRALCEQGRAVGATISSGIFFSRTTINLPVQVRLSRWAPPADGWTVIQQCDS
jgi:hypothetical protein